MGHPHNHLRAHRVEKSRVSHLTKGYKSGGSVKAAKIGKEALSLHAKEHEALHAEGKGSKHRMDRPHRAKGGRVKGKNSARTIVNVITGGHPAGGAVPPAPIAPPSPAPGMGPAAMPPPMAAKPPMPPMGPPGGPPMPMRAKGGRVQTPTGTGVAPESSKAKENKGSPVYNASLRAGTKVSHDDGKSDGKDIGRGRVVTFKAGGAVKTFRAYGGKVEAPQGVAKASKLPGGSGGGEARLVKAKRAAHSYHGAD